MNEKQTKFKDQKMYNIPTVSSHYRLRRFRFPSPPEDYYHSTRKPYTPESEEERDRQESVRKAKIAAKEVKRKANKRKKAEKERRMWERKAREVKEKYERERLQREEEEERLRVEMEELWFRGGGSGSVNWEGDGGGRGRPCTPDRRVGTDGERVGKEEGVGCVAVGTPSPGSWTVDSPFSVSGIFGTPDGYTTAGTTPEKSDKYQNNNDNGIGKNTADSPLTTNTLDNTRNLSTQSKTVISKPESPIHTSAPADDYANDQALLDKISCPIDPNDPVHQIKLSYGRFAMKATPEPVGQYAYLIRACVQCEVEGVQCSRQVPTCTQCVRRFSGAERNRVGIGGYVGGDGEAYSGVGWGARAGKWWQGIVAGGGRNGVEGMVEQQCLVQRNWRLEEIFAAPLEARPVRRHTILLRLESDGDEAWKGKLSETTRVSESSFINIS